MNLELLVVGHLSRDLLITPTLRRETLGGGTAYAMLAPALGVTSGIISRVGDDFEVDYQTTLQNSGLNLAGLHKSGSVSTRFINEYDEAGNRTQHIEHLATPILPDDIGPLLPSSCIHFTPLTRIEISTACFKLAASSKAIVSLDVQGFARGVQADLVIPRKWSYAADILQFVDIVKADTQELTAITGVNSISEAKEILLSYGVETVVLTRDRDGSTIYTQNEQLEIPLVLADLVLDTTGSGDTYMIGFLCEYIRTRDLFQSGVFGAACASLNLETIGPSSFPSRAEVEERMSRYL